MSTSVEFPYAATEQHIELLQGRTSKLTSALTDAEEQYMTSVARSYRNDEIDCVELQRVYHKLRDGGSVNLSKRWTRAVGMSPPQLAAAVKLHKFNTADEWDGVVGRYVDVPGTGVNVVYVLAAESYEPCYVGSTGNLRQRLKQHVADGKSFTTWKAYRCEDRRHAYEVESRFLRQYMPKLNIQGPRRSKSDDDSGVAVEVPHTLLASRFIRLLLRAMRSDEQIVSAISSEFVAIMNAAVDQHALVADESRHRLSCKILDEGIYHLFTDLGLDTTPERLNGP